MACFTNPGFWVYLIVLIGLISIAKILFPWIVSFFGFPAPVPQILMIILWVVIACIGVYFLFAIIGCFGSLSVPSFPHGR
jgi:predicted membrane channel-forming protein YqfA (hemolysin III family)